MLSRLRQTTTLAIAFFLGFLLANTALPIVAIDGLKAARLSWAAARNSSGSSGIVYLLLAGFLLGQAVFLTCRRGWTRLVDRRTRVRWAEQAARWDAATGLPNRFGVQEYLATCAVWSREDPTVRMQSMAFFGIRNLRELNRAQGTHTGTALLQSIAAELRSAALPEAASRLRDFITRRFPNRADYLNRGVPALRYPGRWNGATFALVFRSLDERQAVSIVANLAAWIRSELRAVDTDSNLELCVSFVVGTPSASALALEAVATEGLRAADGKTITVVCDTGDARASAMAQLPDTKILELPIARDLTEADAPVEHAGMARRVRTWLHEWGAAAGCFLLACAILYVGMAGSKRTDVVRAYPWPDDLAEFPVVDASGAKRVRLVRRHPPDEAHGRWQVADVKITQAAEFDPRFRMAQIHVAIKNLGTSVRFVSLFDFTALDSAGHELEFDPRFILNLAQPIDGKWLAAGETWSGWLQIPRHPEPITGIVFKPDPTSRVELRSRD